MGYYHTHILVTTTSTEIIHLGNLYCKIELAAPSFKQLVSNERLDNTI